MHRGLRRLTRWGAPWLLLAGSLGPTAQAQPDAEATGDAIQVLASYHRGSPWSDELVDRIEEAAIQLGWDEGLDVDYLDARRLGLETAFDIERRRLAERRAVAPAERVLLIDDAALRFYLRHPAALDHPTRVVAIGINDPELLARAIERGVRVIVTRRVERQSLAFLRALFGEPLSLLVLGDEQGSGRYLTRHFLDSIAEEPEIRAARVLWEWRPESVLAALERLPADTRVYLVEGHTTGAQDLYPGSREWLERLAERGVRVFCHLPYQVSLGCAGGALLDTRRLGRLAVESLISPAFEALPAIQEVGAGRYALHASFHRQAPEAYRDSIEWLAVEGTIANADSRISLLIRGGGAVTAVLLAALLLMGLSRRRARRAQRRLAIDPGSGLPTRQVLENELPGLCRRHAGGWLFALVSPGLRDYRQHLGLPAAQALFREQLATLRRLLPRAGRLYLNADLGVIGFLPLHDRDQAEPLVDRMLTSLAHASDEGGIRRLAWYASLLRLPGSEADFPQCRAALDDGLFRLERQGWRQPLIRVEPLDRERATRFRQLSDALEGLIDDPGREWRLVLQPKVAAADGELRGAEVLLRWHHPVLGEISPGEFLPVAEILGLASRLDHWVMEESLTWLAAARPRLPGLGSLAINVKLATLAEAAFRRRLLERLQALALPASMIELEVTEHSDFRDLEAVERHMNDLRAHGVRLALDDFGTGNTSFQLIQRLPFTAIKMDRSLLLGADRYPRAREAYAAMVQFSRHLGLAVVAEGVEEPEQAEWLRSLGIDEVQGFLFARPLEPAVMLSRYGR
ncbi:EAL domain-containing protein [Halomonas sp. H10-9-1]|uniref:EAL domain-containing protein n=1 Tax=Halomonas sp. H10-9-1 TaxID=2950871 RepID=UPI0032DF356B